MVDNFQDVLMHTACLLCGNSHHTKRVFDGWPLLFLAQDYSFFFIIINKGECRDRWLFSTLIFSFLFLSFENCSTDDAPNSISLCYHLFVYIYDDVIIFMQRTPFGQ